jgi:hypothetical protein
MLLISAIAFAAGMPCPGTGAWFGHAKTELTTLAKASCADVGAEMVARAGGQHGWYDPHNGGTYAVLSSSPTEIRTSRTANPEHSVGGIKYVDKQVLTLTEKNGNCEIAACSESQGTSVKDFSTNYCDLRNLFCGSADGCKPVQHDFESVQESVNASSGQSEFAQCITNPHFRKWDFPRLGFQSMKCPGSGAWFGHAKTEVVATAMTDCANVKAEIVARAQAQLGWVDPHNGGTYAVLSIRAAEIETSRTANMNHSFAGLEYVEKQVFTLSDKPYVTCEISACSESQGISIKDFSTNYCDIRNLYCGKADGCTPVLHNFASTQNSVEASSGQADFSSCIVKAVTTMVV